MKYGHDKTVHRTEHVDVEVTPDGRVVSVWFRCMMLPFMQSVAAADRASEMDQAYSESGRPNSMRRLVAVEFAE